MIDSNNNFIKNLASKEGGVVYSESSNFRINTTNFFIENFSYKGGCFSNF